MFDQGHWVPILKAPLYDEQNLELSGKMAAFHLQFGPRTTSYIKIKQNDGPNHHRGALGAGVGMEAQIVLRSHVPLRVEGL